jgi:outer membrane protein OmpU
MMKKILFATTALAAAGMAFYPTSDALAQDAMKKPQPVKINVGGFFNSSVGFASQDSAFENAAGSDIRPFRVFNDSEIYFSGNTTLDNGLRVDVIVQLETDQAIANPGVGAAGNVNSDKAIDESYVKLTGAFGDVRVGTTKAGSFVLGTPTLPAGMIRHDTLDPGKFVTAPGVAGGFTGVNSPASPFFLNGITWDVGPSDALKVVYISPQFAGFRIGGSYWPSGPGGDNHDSQPPGSTNSAYDVALQYQNKFGDIGVSSTISYVHNTNGNNASIDTKIWNGGVAVSYGGFRLAGRYGQAGTSHDEGVGANQAIIDDEQWDAELRYASGPFAVSFTYMKGTSEDTVAIAADTTRTIYMLGGQYTIGPGVTLGANVFHVDWDDETTAAINNNDGWAVVGGIKVRF